MCNLDLHHLIAFPVAGQMREAGMGAFVLPDRGIIKRPAIIEDVCVPEFFASGAIVRAGKEIVSIVLYRTHAGVSLGRCEHRQTLLLTMPRTGFDRSFLLAAVEWEPMPGWPGYLTMQ